MADGYFDLFDTMQDPYALAGLSAGVGALGAFSQYNSNMTQAKQFETKRKNIETSRQQAKMRASSVSADLASDFNNTMANNAVIAAAQGRKFDGSVQAQAQAGQQQYYWDQNMSDLSLDYELNGLDAEDYRSRIAQQQAESNAQINLFTSLLGTAASTASLGL